MSNGSELACEIGCYQLDRLNQLDLWSYGPIDSAAKAAVIQLHYIQLTNHIHIQPHNRKLVYSCPIMSYLT